MPTCTPSSTTTVNFGFCKPADGETNWGTAYRTTMDAIDTAIFNAGIPRSYLAGLGTTPTVASTSVSIAVGVCKGNDQSTTITLTSPLVKVLSSSWSVGSGNGGLYAATSIQGLQSYHLFVIIRTDTSVVDAYYDTSPLATNIPAPYTVYRRIASFRTTTSANMIDYVQDGDLFQFKTGRPDIVTTNPGTAAVSAVINSIASGINVYAIMNIATTQSAVSNTALLLSDPAVDDQTASTNIAPYGQEYNVNASANNGCGWAMVRTNTSSTIRYRISGSDGSTVVRLSAQGYYDRRGRDA